MNTEHATNYLQALAASLTIGVIIPLVILIVMVSLGWVLIGRAQANESFEVSDCLRDENGKVASEQILLMATWAFSSWVLSVVVFALPAHVIEAYVAYLGVWGTTSAAKAFFAHKYGGVQPSK